MSDNRPIYNSVAALAAYASPNKVIPARRPRPANQAQIPSSSKAADPEEVVEYWAFGERYFYTSARPDLRLDDDRDFRVERGEAQRQAMQRLHNVKARDFAYEQHGVKVAESCRCTHTAMKRQEWNRVLKYHKMQELPVYFPQQIIGGSSQSQNQGATQPNSPVRTQANSPAPTEPGSPRPADGPSTLNDNPLSRQPNPGDLAAALAAADLTLRAHHDPITSAGDTKRAIQDTTRTPSPEPVERTLPVTRVNGLRREAAIAFSDDASTSDASKKPPSAEPEVPAVPIDDTEPPTERNSAAAPAPSTLPASSSISATRAPHTPLNASDTSLSRMVFGGDSPLTPFSGTPTGSFALSLKRRRSITNSGRVGSDSNLRRRLSLEDEPARPKKRVRRAAEKVVAPTTRTTRSSSKAGAQTGTTAALPSNTPAAAAKARTIAKTRLRKASATATALATPSRTKNAPKKASAKASGVKTRGKVKGRS